MSKLVTLRSKLVTKSPESARKSSGSSGKTSESVRKSSKSVTTWSTGLCLPRVEPPAPDRRQHGGQRQEGEPHDAGAEGLGGPDEEDLRALVGVHDVVDVLADGREVRADAHEDGP